jgi:integral membrane sensor domain MASE1
MVVLATSKLARAVALSGASLVMAQLGSSLSLPSSFATFWPPSGLLLAALLRSDRRMWPWLVLATCPANLAFDALHGRQFVISFPYWAANALQAITGAWLLRRTVGTPFTMGRVRHIVALATLAGLGSTAVSATVGAWATVIWQGAGAYWSLWKLLWMANTIGVLVVAPIILAWTEPRPQSLPMRRPLEWLGFLLITAILVGLVIARPQVPWLPPRALVVVAIPVLGWAAWRLGPRGAAIGLFTIAILGIKNHLDGVGILVAGGEVTADSVLMIQAFLGGLVVTFLLIRAGVVEWAEIEAALRRADQL